MKKKPYKYLKLYNEWMKTGRLRQGNGLCNEFYHDELFDLISPSKDEVLAHVSDGYSLIFWGSEQFIHGSERYGAFNPFRQTIVLFMAAMNGEL